MLQSKLGTTVILRKQCFTDNKFLKFIVRLKMQKYEKNT